MNWPESFSNSSTSSWLIVRAEGLIESSSRTTIFFAAATRPSMFSDAAAIPDVTAAASIMTTMTVRLITRRSRLSISVLSI